MQHLPRSTGARPPNLPGVATPRVSPARSGPYAEGVLAQRCLPSAGGDPLRHLAPAVEVLRWTGGEVRSFPGADHVPTSAATRRKGRGPRARAAKGAEGEAG